jgi:hypothetical protein
LYHGNILSSSFSFSVSLLVQVFLRANIEVAVFEVGIGGRYDATNVLVHPVACGVTLLSLEHVALLGKTVGEIAYQKGGIFKVRRQNSVSLSIYLSLSFFLSFFMLICLLLSVFSLSHDRSQFMIVFKLMSIRTFYHYLSCSSF